MEPRLATAKLNSRHATVHCWGHGGSSSFYGDLARNPSMHTDLDHNNNNNKNNSLGKVGIGRQDRGWSFSSPKDLGGASSSESDCSRPPSPLQLAALEEGMDDERKLLPTDHHSQLRAEVSSLKELVGNLVSLISLNKVYPNNLELGTCDHVWKRACKDKLLREKGAKQEDPSNKQQQLRQQEQKQLPKGQLEQADLSSQQKLEQQTCNSNIPKTTTTNKQQQHAAPTT